MNISFIIYEKRTGSGNIYSPEKGGGVHKFLEFLSKR